MLNASLTLITEYTNRAFFGQGWNLKIQQLGSVYVFFMILNNATLYPSISLWDDLEFF